MTEGEAVDLVSKLISRGRSIPLRDISPETHLVSDLGLDSLDAAELLAALHAETGKQLDFTSMEDFQTVGSVAKILLVSLEESDA
ncbi:acyl carrier protein [Nonomuraea lactucae]|uniref:acyl carrier protein n=1 Tax=Nonomuraea lactucae TaxID=2249762 RepID=UPI0013B3926A|nr:phosphopantetheine-binding protein [Nonomuraea lactucae]